MGVVGVRYGSVGKCYAVGGEDAVLGVDVTEEMETGMNLHYFGKKLFITVVSVVIEVEDTVGWAVGYQNIGVSGDFGDVTLLAVGDAVAHKHWDSVEFHSVDLYSGVAQVVYIGVKTVDIGAV